MADLISRLDLYAIGRDFLLTRAKKINPAMVDVAGTDANMFVGSASVIAAALIRQLAYSVNRLLLDGAEDEDLDRYAFDRYNENRKGASPAVGSVRLFRASAGGGAGTVPVGTRLRTNTGVEYVTTTTANFGVSDLSTSGVFVSATQAGKATQVGANMIRQFSDTGSLFDTTLQVNNDAPTAGGEDAESDEVFRDRIRQFWLTQSRGTLSAIERGALSVPGVVSARAEEVLTVIGTTSIPARVVNLYIADSSGVASDALAAQVLTALVDYRAAGIAVVISNSLPQLVDIVLVLSFSATVDTNALSEAVRTAILEFINSLPVNGTLYRGELQSVLVRFKPDGLIVSEDAIVAPVGDLVPDLGRTIRTISTMINIT